MNFDQNSIYVCYWGSNKQYPNIGLDNSLASTRRQAIIWTNAGSSNDEYMRQSASMI